MNNIVGILPAAGIAKRMQPYSGPKELLPVGYHPVQVGIETKLIPMAVSQYMINAMAKADIRNIYFVLSPQKWEIFKFFKSGAYWGIHFGYLCQDEPVGMPGALDSAYPWLQNQVVVMGMPDTIVEPADCFLQLLRFHTEKKAHLTLGIFPTQNPQALAPVHVDPTTNRVKEIFDKPAMPLYFNTWGIAAWAPAFTELLHDYVDRSTKQRQQHELLLSDIFSEAIVQGMDVYGYIFPHGKFYDIGTPEGLIQSRLALEYQLSSSKISE